MFERKKMANKEQNNHKNNRHHFTETVLWQKARELMSWNYKTVRDNIDTEPLFRDIYTLSYQMPAEIAASYARSFPGDIIKKLHTARELAYRLESHFYLAMDMEYITEDTFNEFSQKIKEIKSHINSHTSKFKQRK